MSFGLIAIVIALVALMVVVAVGIVVFASLADRDRKRNDE
jgi:hypothetical protein